MQQNLNRGYYLTDAMGSITGFTNDSGTLTGSWRYDPYGNPTSGSPTSNGVFLGFAGGYTDKEASSTSDSGSTTRGWAAGRSPTRSTRPAT